MKTQAYRPSIFKRARRGGAVLFVLGLIFAASIIMVSLMEYAALEIKPRVSANYERNLRTDAYSALNAAIAVLKEYQKIDSGLFTAEQGWGAPLEDGRIALYSDGGTKRLAETEIKELRSGSKSEIQFEEREEGATKNKVLPVIFPSGNEVVVKISDECAKIVLSKLDSTALVYIFEEMGISSTKAQTMADCLLDWTDSDDAASINGAEYDDYDSLEAFPPNRPLRSLNELRYVKNFEAFFDDEGNPNEMFKRFAKLVSVDNSDKVNLNSASEDVLRMLMESEGKDYDDSLYKAIRGEIGQISDGITWAKNASEVSNRGARDVPVKNCAYQTTLLKIEVFVKRATAQYYLCAYYGSQMEGAEGTSSSSSSSNRASGSSSGSGKSSAGGSSSGQKLATNADSQSNKRGSSSSGGTSRSSSSGGSRSGSGAKVLKILEHGR